MTAEPPEWLVETTEEFDEDYAALSVIGGQQLESFRQSWCFYLHRNPVLMAKGITGPDDDDCRVMAYADADLGIEYVLGVSIDRGRRHVLIRWLDSSRFDPRY